MRRFPDRDRIEMGSERRASDPTGGPAIRSKCRAPTAGSGCSNSICESTSGTCTSGDDTGDTHACTAWPKRPKHIPPSRIGRTTCRTPMSTAWRAMIRSGWRNTQWIQIGPMGTVLRAGGERDRPGLPACQDSTEALWPVPRPGRWRATGTAVHHPPSSH